MNAELTKITEGRELQSHKGTMSESRAHRRGEAVKTISSIPYLKRPGYRTTKYLLIGLLIGILLWGEVQDLFLYRDSGVVEHIFNNGPSLYFRLMDGRVYRSNACKAGIDKGNFIRFTAIDAPNEGQETSTPVIIRCKFISWALGTPLP